MPLGLSPSFTHTYAHTYNNGRLGFVFPWQSVPAIFPRWQRNMALKCRTKPCVCVCVCVSVQRVILSREEPRCSDTHWAASSLDPVVSALIPALTETQIIKKIFGSCTRHLISEKSAKSVMFPKKKQYSATEVGHSLWGKSVNPNQMNLQLAIVSELIH